MEGKSGERVRQVLLTPARGRLPHRENRGGRSVCLVEGPCLWWVGPGEVTWYEEGPPFSERRLISWRARGERSPRSRRNARKGTGGSLRARSRNVLIPPERVSLTEAPTKRGSARATLCGGNAAQCPVFTVGITKQVNSAKRIRGFDKFGVMLVFILGCAHAIVKIAGHFTGRFQGDLHSLLK